MSNVKCHVLCKITAQLLLKLDSLGTDPYINSTVLTALDKTDPSFSHQVFKQLAKTFYSVPVYSPQWGSTMTAISQCVVRMN